MIFLLPMSRWHLYAEFKNGVNVGGAIQYVWLFGLIGLFVLMLACINFMNLSTARSERRAKEVGIRKAIGSLRSQLVKQFFMESTMVAVFAFVCSILLAQLLLPYFNAVAGKQMHLLWGNVLFWLAGAGITVFTGLIAGLYPAFYLSSFQPAKVLKGTFKVGRLAAMPRQILVIVQFTISVVLIIGTMVVFRQVQFTKNRPVGYSRDGLLNVSVITDDIHKNFAAISQELKNTGAISAMAESSGEITSVNEVDNGFSWSGKDASVQGNFAVVYASHNYGKTIGWQVSAGRDFSENFLTDSTGIILNETAARFMGLKHPIGQTVNWDGKNFHIIGVIKDMVMQSPYSPVFRSVFVSDPNAQPIINIKINPRTSTHQALATIGEVFKKYNPAQPFNYQFTDEQYARKFGDEERVGKLASGFAGLAILISCLGLFGMASFMAEQRIKEIGVRKVLGASVLNLWGLLSKDFVKLIVISLLIAIPVSYYFMQGWLQNYQYRSTITWWIFAATALGAILITLLTVSYQSIRAALANPVKSLRAE